MPFIERKFFRRFLFVSRLINFQIIFNVENKIITITIIVKINRNNTRSIDRFFLEKNYHDFLIFFRVL